MMELSLLYSSLNGEDIAKFSSNTLFFEIFGTIALKYFYRNVPHDENMCLFGSKNSHRLQPINYQHLPPVICKQKNRKI